MSYLEALEKTQEAAVRAPAPGSAEEAAAIQRIRDFFADMTEESVKAQARHVYAPQAYLYDTLKELNGVDAIESYFTETAARVESVAVDFTDVARSGDEFYLRWVMVIKSRRFNGGEPTSSFGMSHMRLDEEGQILVHHDYWDSGTNLFSYLPLVGGLIRWFKKRL